MKCRWALSALPMVLPLLTLVVSETAKGAEETYVLVEFYAVRDTIRDTTVFDSASLAIALPILPEESSEAMTFSLYASPSGGEGPALWSEQWTAVPIGPGGLVKVLLGSKKKMAGSLFSGGMPRFLQIEIAGRVLSPRITLINASQILLLTESKSMFETSSASSPKTKRAGMTSSGAAAFDDDMSFRTTVVFRDANKDVLGIDIAGLSDAPVDVRTALVNGRIKALLAEAARLKAALPMVAPVGE